MKFNWLDFFTTHFRLPEMHEYDALQQPLVQNQPPEVEDIQNLTDHLRGIYRKHLKFRKKCWRMSTCNQLNFFFFFFFFWRQQADMPTPKHMRHFTTWQVYVKYMMHCNNHLTNGKNQPLVHINKLKLKTSKILLIILKEFRENTSNLWRNTERCQHVIGWSSSSSSSFGDKRPTCQHQSTWGNWPPDKFLSSRKKISQLGIEPPTSSLRVGYLSTVIQ